MKITHSAYVLQDSETVVAAAKSWLREESGGIEPTITRDADNRQLIMVEILSDNVLISSGYIISPAEDGTNVHFLLEMRGTTALSRLRNLGMNIARRMVARESEASFQEFTASLPSSR